MQHRLPLTSSRMGAMAQHPSRCISGSPHAWAGGISAVGQRCGPTGTGPGGRGRAVGAQRCEPAEPGAAGRHREPASGQVGGWVSGRAGGCEESNWVGRQAGGECASSTLYGLYSAKPESPNFASPRRADGDEYSCGVNMPWGRVATADRTARPPHQLADGEKPSEAAFAGPLILAQALGMSGYNRRFTESLPFDDSRGSTGCPMRTFITIFKCKH
jgi:hypothetical protein